MGLEEAVALGKKVIGGVKKAYKIGMKVYNFFSGKRLGQKETKVAQDKYGYELAKKPIREQNLSSDDFIKQTNKPQPTIQQRLAPIGSLEGESQRMRKGNTEKAIERLTAPTESKVAKAKNVVSAIKGGVDIVKNVSKGDINSLNQVRNDTRRQIEKVNEPTLREITKRTEDQRVLQRQLTTGTTDITKLTEEELKRKIEEADPTRKKKRGFLGIRRNR